MFRFRISNNALIIIYKLLNDALFIALVFFLLALTAEGFLPGVVSSHINFTKTVIFIALILTVAFILAKAVGIDIQNPKTNKKTAVFWLFVFSVLVFGSLWKLNIFLNLFILILVILTMYFVYKITLEEKSGS